MDRQILSIKVTDEINDAFRDYFAIKHLALVPCNRADDVLRVMTKENFCLVIFNASDLDSNEAQNFVSRLRNLTYSPMLVFSFEDSAAAVMEVGADVCMSMGTDLHIIFAQAMALIRRHKIYDLYDTTGHDDATIYRGDLMIDSMRHRVTQAGQEIKLLPREFRLLSYLARNPDKVLSPEQLRYAIWLSEADDNRDITPAIAILRQKLNDDKNDPKYIKTERGVGYRFLL